ncbi:hypothetical protein B296_00048684 [Ensete ventricosum]|uniref:Uncharacterized protein n=1 Tax=Ensete ventricosum TaxID=4639 RepID=A0A426Y4B9_ENSVE|nr:hypothetical protein B296_00048684 [Ensete ventricosum]
MLCTRCRFPNNLTTGHRFVYFTVRGVNGRGNESYGAVVAIEVRASEAQSLAEHLRIELHKANDYQASTETDLEIARAELANLWR